MLLAETRHHLWRNDVSELESFKIMNLNYNRSPFRDIDKLLGDYCREKFSAENLVSYSAAVVSSALSAGHICVDIDEGKPEEIWDSEEKDLPQFPDKSLWLEALEKSGCVGNGETPTPLTLDKNRLYLFRYYKYELSVATEILSRLSSQNSPDTKKIEIVVQSLFNETEDLSSFGGDLQLAGALLPLFSRFSVLSGGPGTGKTTTLTKMLALLLTLNPDAKIALAAPTGKAAMRMNESISASVLDIKERGILPAETLEKLEKLKASTIHRMLGVIHQSPNFKHNSTNHLNADLVVIDEASMIDLPLMSKLLSAIKPTATTTLLGDMDQLSSVEAGAVLGDICSAFGENRLSPEIANTYNSFANSNNQLNSSTALSPVIKLHKSYRFDSNSGVGLISKLINSGESEKAVEEMTKSSSEVYFNSKMSQQEIEKIAKESYKFLMKSKTPEDALNAISKFSVLTATHLGRSGREFINQLLINHFNPSVDKTKLFDNLPIMISTNDYHQSLYNGDSGVIKKINGEFKACFRDETGVRELSPILLPKWEPAFAITVHKSQGSEFNSLLFLAGDNKRLTRELIYTAITRAKPQKGSFEKAVTITGNEESLKRGIANKSIRKSGLQDRLK